MTRMNVLALVMAGALAGHAQATPYTPPVAGSTYTFNSSSSGEITVEILSSDQDTFATRTRRQQGGESEERRLFGIYPMSKQFNEGILGRDRVKAAGFFPLEVGKKVIFDTFGQTNGPRWYRSHTWEAVRQYTLQIGQDSHQVFVIKTVAESPGFFKFDGTCDYSTTYAACLKTEGTLFVSTRPELNGPLSSRMTKAVVRGVAVNIPDLQSAAISTPNAAPAPLPANIPAQQDPAPVATQVPPPLSAPAQTSAPPMPSPVVVGPTPATANSPATATSPAQTSSAEQRLKQAKDLLDKKLITQHQYDEFVARIMKDM